MNPFGTQNGVATPAGVTDGASRPVTGNGKNVLNYFCIVSCYLLQAETSRTSLTVTVMKLVSIHQLFVRDY